MTDGFDAQGILLGPVHTTNTPATAARPGWQLPNGKNMKFSVAVFTICLGISMSSAVFATSEVQHATITRLGELNGVALQCRYFDQMQRIKQTLVANLPKRRELGLLFEDSTNKSFMAFMQQDKTCPGSADFVSQVDSAVSDLETAFAK